MIPALLLALQAPGSHGPEPGPRVPVAGLAGFQVVSRLDFGGPVNRLTAVYVFPDRARWHFESYESEGPGQHQFLYRSGERVHELQGNRSRAMPDEGRDLVLLQMELRRAVFQWPDGFSWQDLEDGRRTAPVEADTCCAERRIGSLVATLEQGRPTRIEARVASGAAHETLEIRSWQEQAGRSWPRTLRLRSEHGGFEETVEAIETRVHFLELSFLPPDQRPVPGRSRPGPEIWARDLVAMTYAVRPLPDGCEWPAALEKAQLWIEEAATALAGRGLAVDPVPTFELSPAGRPLRCLVRLVRPETPPPEGFESVAERAGLFSLLERLDSLDTAALDELLRAAPPEGRPGTPYVRIHPRSSRSLELVLPLEPRDP